MLSFGVNISKQILEAVGMSCVMIVELRELALR